MKQILIVEDDSFLNKMLAYNLTADGYGVTSALNARTAATPSASGNLIWCCWTSTCRTGMGLSCAS